MDPTTIQALMLKRNGVLLPKQAVSYLKAVENDPLQLESVTIQISAAAPLVCYLKSRQDISYFVVYDNPTSNLITIPKKRRCMVKKLLFEQRASQMRQRK
jgi:hypothetical protein